MNIANFIVLGLATYATVGMLFAIAFVVKGVGSIDATAAHAPLGFRLIILPGAAALWPLLLRRWLRARDRDHRHTSRTNTNGTLTLERHS